MASVRKRLLLLAILTEGLAFVLAAALAAWLGIPLYPHGAPFLSHLLMGMLWTIPPLSLFLLLMSRPAAGMRGIGALQRKMVNDIRPLFAQSSAVDLIFIALLAGIAEECLFRGVIQTKWDLIPASVIFGLFHFVTPLYAAVATVMGFYLGLLYWAYGNLIVPVQVHFLYDLGALLYLRYGRFPWQDSVAASNGGFVSGQIGISEKGDSR